MLGARHGQHFLINPRIAQKQIELAELTPSDVVLEIGPGHGILTHLLAAKVNKVIAVEIDASLVAELQQTLPANVELIHADILNLDLTKLPKFTKIVANLPYQISSEITFRLLDLSFDLAVLMYQYDFAARMIADPGTKTYGRLSVGIAYKTQCTLESKVLRGNFSPPPQVHSAIIKMIPRTNPPFEVYDETIFFDVTRVLFNHRRKKIKTIFKNHYQLSNVPYADYRVEQLSPEEIGLLSNYLFEHHR